MTYREHAPCPALRPFIACYWTRTDSRRDPAVPLVAHRVLPDGCIDILFRLPGRGRETAAAHSLVVGAMRTSIWVPGDRDEIVAVRFLPGGAGPLLGLPLHELTDRAQALDDFFGSQARAIEERLQKTQGEARVRLLEEVLLVRVARARPSDAVISSLARSALGSGRVSTVDALVRASGLSSRQLERRFLISVGLGPKLFLRIARFQRAVERFRVGSFRRLTDLALDCGYCDQSHMSRDFKLLSGESPARFAASEGLAMSMSDSSKTLHAP